MASRSRRRLTYPPAAYESGFAGMASDILWGSEKPDDTTVGGFAKKYWWALLVSVPLAYVGINVALDKLGDKR